MEDQTLSPVPAVERHQDPPEQAVPAEDPSSSAYLKISTLGSTTVEARGTVPLICVAGILGAVVTAYIAAHAPEHDLSWFLGLAAAELALAGAVIFRITRRGRRR